MPISLRSAHRAPPPSTRLSMSEPARTTAAAMRARSYGTAAVVFALDRFTKWIVESNLTAFDTVRVIPGLFNIVRSENRGMAFGIMNDASLEWRTTLLIVAAAAAVVFMAVLLWKPQ